MGLTPLDVTTKEKIITLHLAGLGRNEICRQFQKEGLSVSSGSISNVIKRYKLEHEPPLQSQYQQTSSKSKMVDNSDGSSIPELAIPNPESRIEALSHPSAEAEVNIESADTSTKNVFKEDETISREKEKFKQHYKPSSSSSSHSSGYPQDIRDREEDQDQEDEQDIDLGINWALEEEENRKRSFKEESKQHQSQYTSYLKLTNLGIDYSQRPTIGIDLDSDEKWESNFWARVMGEKEERRRELQTIEQQWQAIGEERQENAQMREWLEEQKNNLKVREAKVAEVESLAPSVR